MLVLESSNLHSDSALQEVIGKSPEEIKEEADEIVALTRQLTALKNKYTNLEKKSLLLKITAKKFINQEFN